MNNLLRILVLEILLAGCTSTQAVTRYVYLNSTTPIAPYTTWNTAATNIQDAIGAANNGDLILVSNGVYKVGGQVSGGVSNRVAVIKPLSLVSVNGSGVTTIDGDGTMRCVFLTNGAILSGFTITNGSASNGGGVFCSSTNATISNSILTRNSAQSGGGAYSGYLTNCTLSFNLCRGTGGNGGGATASLLESCNLTGNETGTPYPGSSGSSWGGGASGAILFNCTLTGNKSWGAGASGGGVSASVLNNCTISGSRADYGPGGAADCTMTNCVIFSNQAGYSGGGVSGGTLVNCVIRNNDGGLYGGGVNWTTTLFNCTVVGNYAQRGGGGASCTFYNCIVYYNTASTGPNTLGCAYEYTCTPDLGGVGNISGAPAFASQATGDLRLLAGSAGINAGTNRYAVSQSDMDGNLRIANGTVDMGAYEYQAPNPATVSIQCDYTNVVIGITASFKGIFSRGKTVSWNFGDGTILSNQVFTTHAWASPGNYSVTLTMYDGSNPSGVSATYLIHVVSPPLAYVSQASLNPVAPYSSWATAASNIQDAVDSAVSGTHIFVTNGNYQTGGRVNYGNLTNRLVIHKPVVVRSVNGPEVTMIQGNPIPGDAAVRCVYLTNGATLNGFALLNGSTRIGGDWTKEQSGGGVWCESTNAFIINCVLSNNMAQGSGGAVYRGTISNCVLNGNSVVNTGGAAHSSTLLNCLILSNRAVNTWDTGVGGGAASCYLSNCVVAGNWTANNNNSSCVGGGVLESTLISCTLSNNSAQGDGGGAYGSSLRNCVLFRNTGGYGGGAASSTLSASQIISNTAAVGGGCYGGAGTNCLVQGNASGYQGGGVCGTYMYNSLIAGNSGSVGGGAAGTPGGVGSTLVNCTVLGNSASFRCGGTANSKAWNSIIVSNSGPEPSDWYASALNYCCATPLPDTGVGNITNTPLFVDQFGGNFRLQPNSSCINAGTNAYALLGADLDGNPRIVADTVDLGAYESQSPALQAYFSWAQSFGLPTTAAAVYEDWDTDGINNYCEWRSDTIPTNAVSVFRIAGVTNSPAGASVAWQSVASRSYWIERATNLGIASHFYLMATNIQGVAGLRTYSDTSATNYPTVLYRVGVQ